MREMFQYCQNVTQPTNWLKLIKGGHGCGVKPNLLYFSELLSDDGTPELLTEVSYFHFAFPSTRKDYIELKQLQLSLACLRLALRI